MCICYTSIYATAGPVSLVVLENAEFIALVQLGLSIK